MEYFYRKRSDATWAQARDDFLAGMTAEQVCMRHDLGLRAFWDRARREGWRRCDQTEPVDEMERLMIFGDYEPGDLEAMARIRVIAATARGQAAEAARWRRIYEFWAAEAQEVRRWLVAEAEERLRESAQTAR